MKVVVELSPEEMESYKNAMRRGFGNSAMRKIINGTPLPEGAEILTAEAYSDLCLRASRIPCYLGSPCEYQNEDIKIPPQTDWIPERRTGKWRNKSTRNPFSTCKDRIYWRACSACGWCREDCNTANDTPYCPNCGAEMKGGAE